MSQRPEQTDELSQLKQALVALKKMRTKLEALERSRHEPIAIIGMACEFPGASDLESFWRLLRDGVNAVTEVPPNRWNLEDYYDPDPGAAGKSYARHGAFLDRDPAHFDAEFFGISAQEAECLDPQQRLLLETAWHALENAGQSPARLVGSQTGVFMGLSNDDYSKLHLTGDPASINPFSGTGSHFSVAVGRLCYVLGLNGPNFPVDTACSSSLITTHIACQSLRQGECRMALAGGVNLLLWPEGTVYFSKLRALARDGRSKAFDAEADGYVRGEGCGVIVLKRLSDAQADGDRILAVIRGSAINHNGRSNGLTAPNGAAQRAVIRAALANAGVEPQAVSYVEAHGTATSLGDSVELEAAGEVLGGNREDMGRVAIATLKTNVGHLEAAAGVAALIKVVLSLQHRQIPAHLHFHRPNPNLDWNTLPLRVPTALEPWAAPGKLIAGVSAFSYSGTNAHVIVEEAPEREREVEGFDRPRHLLCLSAKSEGALRELAERFMEYLETSTESLGNICYSANAGRAHFAHRIAIVAASTKEAQTKLRSAEARQVQPGKRERIAAVMADVSRAKDTLYVTQRAFRKGWDECAGLVRELREQPKLPVEPSAAAGLTEFAAHYGLWQMWRSWGVEPGAVWANGSGELAAAYGAGVYSLVDALGLAAGTAASAAAVQARGRIPLIRGADGLTRLNELGYGLILTLGRRHDEGAPGEWEQIFEDLANLYLNGVEVDWSGVDRGYSRLRVALPQYPFQHKRYWPSHRGGQSEGAHALISHRTQSPLIKETVFDAEWSVRWPLLNDHRLYGTAVVPAAMLLAMALSAAESPSGESACAIQDSVFLRPLLLPEEGTRKVQLVLSPEAGGTASFRVVSRDGSGSWPEHARGTVRRGLSTAHSSAALAEARVRCETDLDVPGFYRDIAEDGLPYGPTFRWLEAAWRGAGEAVGRFRETRRGDDASQFRLHPGVLDTGFQLVRAVVAQDAGGTAYVPIAVDTVIFRESGRAPRWCHTRVRPWSGRTPESLTADLLIFDESGDSIAEISGIHLKRAPKEDLLRGLDRARDEQQAFRLEIPNRGALENLGYQPLARTAPGPGKVEIRVAAAGLNFRDVLNTLGMYPGDAGLLGGECAGTVVAVGKEVECLRVGDAVIASAAGCIGSHVTIPESYAVAKPPQLTFEDAAAIPLAFLTASHGLYDLARIRSSDRILIHAAAGGVGLAAVQLARRVGAEIFATAGNEEKRSFLRGLGIRHVMDSRSLDFAGRVREATSGEGVDVVLNSLSGEFIATSLGLLRANGRFIEIGKSGILTPEQIAQLPGNVAYFSFDLGEIAMTNPAQYRTMLVDIIEHFAKGELTPLPRKDFAAADSVAAFRFMAQARHIGKIVISMGQMPEMAPRVAGSGRAPAPVQTNLLARLADATRRERRELLSDSVSDQAAIVRGLNPSERLDPRRPLKELGFDSLTAVELRNVLAAQFGMSLPASLVFDCPTIEAIAGYLDERLSSIAPAPIVPPRAQDEEVSRILSQIEQVTDDDVELLLRRKEPR